MLNALRVIASVLLLLLCHQAWALPDEFALQGILLGPDGAVAPDGNYDLKIELFDDAQGGSSPFSTTIEGVPVRRALFNVTIAGNGITPLADLLAAGARFLQITIVDAPDAQLVGMVLTPRQPLASVAYAFESSRSEAVQAPISPVPVGAILLWDQPTGCGSVPRACPCGYGVAGEFAGRPVRGADIAGAHVDVPDHPGVSTGEPDGWGRHGDRLTVDEAGSHGHGSSTAANHRHTIGESASQYTVDLSCDGCSPALEAPSSDIGFGEIAHPVLSAGQHTHEVNPTGGGAHYHSFRSVLFCRKQ